MFKLNFKHVCVICLLAIMLFSLCGCKEEGVTGNEWLVIQKACLEDLEAYAAGMDEVYTLYLTSAITQEDFLTEVRLLKAQYITLNQFYDDMKAKNPVKEGTHSYISKRGTEGMEKCYSVLGKILEDTVDGQGRPKAPKELSYTYLAYKQELTTALSEYVTAIVWLEDSQNAA